MEQNNISLPVLVNPVYIQETKHDTDSSTTAFIEANTIKMTLKEIREDQIIPVWLKSNEVLISHDDFIQTTYDVISEIFSGEQILNPSIRVSHPLKGRIPEAKNKPANLLAGHERTICYERMMFCIDIPSIQSEIDGNVLNLTIGGVKSYGEDNLYNNSGADQHFKLFIGFKNRVCTNLCLWSDGYAGNIVVRGLEQLHIMIHSLVKQYNSSHHLFHLRKLADYSLTETQFAQVIGRSRMFHHLPNKLSQEIPELLLGENQMSSVVKDYYSDKSFCRDTSGNINLWRVYNLLTGANKATYIDQFLHRGVNAYNFVEQIRWALEGKSQSWYLQ